MKRVTSRSNSIVQRYREVGRGKDHSAILLDGVHLILEALSIPRLLQHVLVESAAVERPDTASVLERLVQEGIDVVEATAAVIAAASPVASPSGMVALAARPALVAERLYGSGATILIACDIQNPGNLGAMVRVAEASGASGVVAAGTSADPFGWKALRGSMGSALRFPIGREADIGSTIAVARARGCRTIAAMPRGGKAMFDADLRPPLALLVGGEGAGLPEEVAALVDERVTVPMQPPVESLNAAVTAALLLYEARRQRR